MNHLGDYDVIVIGAGHAGIEAAHAAAMLGAKTAVFTMSLDAIGNMPCNPSIGGTAKGTLVRELDALGGVMGLAADATYLQSRMLNKGKGPAVHALRVQTDRKRYHEYMKHALELTPGLAIHQAEIISIEVEDGHVKGVVTQLNGEYGAKCVVIATGTNLGGKIFVGDAWYASGPDGMHAANALTESLKAAGLPLRRFKTGTPARVHRRSIDFSKLECQPGDPDNELQPFSFMTDAPMHNKVVDRCGVARLLFISREPSRLELTLNDSLHRTFDIPASEALRQIVVRAPVASLALRVVRGGAGFTGYGVQFEDAAGVTVDNYSIRSNNGQALFGTNPSVNAQIDAFAEYDLVILQYGLNIMQEGVTNYSAYAARVEKMIAFVRSCFPEAAVLVLSTSDRSVKSDTGFAPMSSAPAMVDWQRRAARATGAAFWSIYDAMRAQGGMERFVANGWAGKDYTHINYAGGRQVAYALVDALDARVAAILRQRQQAALPEPVLDSSKIAALDETMNLRPQPIEPR